MHELRGLFVALLTPFDAAGEVDEATLGEHVKRLISRGVRGFYVCGSTGEAFLLSADERKRVFETVASAAKGGAALICHVGAIGSRLSADLARHAINHGADAISSIPPFYYKFSADEIVGYYEGLASLGTPLIPYNFPALSGVNLDGHLMARLRKHSEVVGIKFTSNDLFQLERMKAADPGLIVLSGYDEVYLGALAMGADGAVGSTFNVMPEKFDAIAAAFKAGSLSEATKAQAEANALIQAMIGTGKLLNAHKYLLGLQGLPFGECREPFLPLTEADKSSLDTAYERFSLS